MQDLKVFITEKLDISKEYSGYNYQPKNRAKLKDLLKDLVKERGLDGDFNDIDTSLVTDMSNLFDHIDSNFNGDISRWNTSNVEFMTGMFEFCHAFNCDISKWDVHNVKSMMMMFHGAGKFNQPIGRWDTSSLRSMNRMFWFAEDFKQDIHRWNVDKVVNNQWAFVKSGIEYKPNYQPKFENYKISC